MKKTYTINLSNQIFYIDEDACLQLQNYIKILEKHYHQQEGGQEIMADIESRIAELCREYLHLHHRETIILSDIDKVIETMGTPDVIINEDNDTPYCHQSTPRKLYRDLDEAIIGGVISGLSAYFGIQPIWIRLIFVLFTFCYGATIVIYTILWIIIPTARTYKQKLEMQGEKINVSNIEKNIRNTCNQIKEEKRLRRIINSLGEYLFNFFSKSWSILTQIFTLFSKLIATVSFISGISLFCFTIFLLWAGQHYLPHTHYTLLQYFCSPTPIGVIKWLLLLLTTIPLLLIIYYSAAYLFHFRGHKAILYSGVGIWMLCCLGGTMMGIIFFTRFSLNYKAENTLPLNTTSKNRTLNIRFHNLPHHQYSSSYFRLNKFLHECSDFYTAQKDSTKLYFRPYINFEACQGETPQIIFIRSTQEIDGMNANKNIENIKYTYKWENDTLSLNTFFSLHQPQYRLNGLKITIQIPEKYKIHMENIIPNNISSLNFHNAQKFKKDLSPNRNYTFRDGTLHEEEK